MIFNKIDQYNSWQSQQKKQFIYLITAFFFSVIILLLAATLLIHPACILLFPFVFVFSQLVDVPSQVISGKITQFSSVFLVETHHKEKRILHTANLFNVWVESKRLKSQKYPKRWILKESVSGLIAFIEELEKEPQRIFTVEGTTYFVGQRTLKKLGFNTSPPTSFQRIILFVNLAPLMITHFLIVRKWQLPPLKNTVTFSCSSSQLIELKPTLQDWEKRL